MQYALDTLENTLTTLETNLPINLQEGNLQQAELEKRGIEDVKTALAWIRHGQELTKGDSNE